MKNGNLLIALIVGGVIGFVIGKTTTVPSSQAAPAAQLADNGAKKNDAKPRPPPADDKAVYKIPLGNGPIKGPANAKVTIVEYSDFQCPFCGRVEGTLKQIEGKYGKDVRITFKENPLPFHDHAQAAAEAAMAANEQGKFWEMHDKMFSNQTALNPPDLEKYAQEIGLDMAKFKAAIESHKYKAQIDADKAEAVTFQANGTPHFFIDGRRIKGAVPLDQFTSVIDDEIKKSDDLLAKGTPAAKLYETKTASGLTKAAAPPPQQQQPPKPQVAEVHEKDFAGAPETGAKHPKVTIVEWSDFQCPFCGRAVPVVDQMLKAYPNDVRVVFKHEPLPFHDHAMPTAIAAVAAQNQGKFWEFYSKAFANQQALTPDNYEKWAQEIGLNVDKFKADIADPKTKERVQADSATGSRVGANGTPTFFVDGRLVSGALPFEQFKTMIDEEIKKADELLKKGTSHTELYEKLLAQNIATAPKAPAQAAAPAPGSDKPVNIAVGNSPVRGDPRAKVTIIEFSDFQCPYCGRAFNTVEDIMKQYDGKVKVVWKNDPLPFHDKAKPAAKAALAAGEQGKFWEMHDKLFQNQKDLSPENFEKWAGEIGLNVDQFKNAIASTKFDDMIDNDTKLGQSVGASGTPTFFINGHILVGAQPIDQFKSVIDAELKK